MDIDWLPLAREGIGLVITLVIVLTILAPLMHAVWKALGRLGDIRSAIVEQSGQCEASRRAIERLCRQNEEANHRLATLQMAIRVAFAGRANGHSWQDAKAHYGVAADLLQDDESDDVLRRIHERDTPPDPHDPTAIP